LRQFLKPALTVALTQNKIVTKEQSLHPNNLLWAINFISRYWD